MNFYLIYVHIFSLAFLQIMGYIIANGMKKPTKG